MDSKSSSLKILLSLFLLVGLFIPTATAQLSSDEAPRVTVVEGQLEGINDSGVKIFKGIPFAESPIGTLRWKAPQPVENWGGTLQANQFGPRCMQRNVFGDMKFRSDGMSEDCLYLNVWTPAKTDGEKLPVLVYFYGGGFMAGDGSEPRYDGESMARNKGIVTVTVNYRLGVFGFLSHAELTDQSPHNASGNYGLLDQAQALKWVKENIASFGGDPNKITIAGESAGSILGALSGVPLSEGEENGQKFVSAMGAESFSELRSVSADSILQTTEQLGVSGFPVTIDGYFFPKSPYKIYENGEQAEIPLLLGWNSAEMNHQFIMQGKKPTPENYQRIVQELYGENTDKVLEYYPGATKEEVIQSATALASDRFIAFSTWKWAEEQSKTSNQPVFRYYYSHPRPPQDDSEKGSQRSLGAAHAAEIEYAMGNLPSNNVYDWTVEDYQVSNIMQNYFANFIKTGNPNGLGLPHWIPLTHQDKRHFMQIYVNMRLQPVQHRERYLFLDKFAGN